MPDPGGEESPIRKKQPTTTAPELGGAVTLVKEEKPSITEVETGGVTSKAAARDKRVEEKYGLLPSESMDRAQVQAKIEKAQRYGSGRKDDPPPDRDLNFEVIGVTEDGEEEQVKREVIRIPAADADEMSATMRLVDNETVARYAVESEEQIKTAFGHLVTLFVPIIKWPRSPLETCRVERVESINLRQGGGGYGTPGHC